MKGKRGWLLYPLVVLALLLCVAPVHADLPTLPHAFYGAVRINDSLAPVGTLVEVRGDGVVGGISNPIAITVAGQYGSPEPLGMKLVVQGEIPEGSVLDFYINGKAADQTAQWYSGEVTELDLTVAMSSSPPPAPTTEPVASPPPPETTPAPPPEAPVSPETAVTETPEPKPSLETPVAGPPPEATTAAAPAPPLPPSPPAQQTAGVQLTWITILGIIGGMVLVSLVVVVIARR